MKKKVIKVKVLRTEKLCEQCKYKFEEHCVSISCKDCHMLSHKGCNCTRIGYRQHCPYFVKRREGGADNG